MRNETLWMVLALMASTVVCVETMVLVEAGQATKHRRSVEQTQFVCLDGDQIARGDRFTECKQVTWRHADEQGVR